jgi:hypothetical protein
MSKIEEIRKRHQERQAGEEPADYSLAFEEAHEDRAALLAALDGEWQSERPEAGEWWVSARPEVRKYWLPHRGRVRVPVTVDALGVMNKGRRWDKDAAVFTGALWQRRTVPGDPFAKGGGE